MKESNIRTILYKNNCIGEFKSSIKIEIIVHDSSSINKTKKHLQSGRYLCNEWQLECSKMFARNKKIKHPIRKLACVQKAEKRSK